MKTVQNNLTAPSVKRRTNRKRTLDVRVRTILSVIFLIMALSGQKVSGQGHYPSWN